MGMDISHLPYSRKGTVACKLLNKSRLFLLLGECGEYELVFTIPSDKESRFLKECATLKLKPTKIGKVTKTPHEIKLIENETHIDLSNYNHQARDFATTSNYIKGVEKYIKTLGHG
jgi:thiamine-monophosphate kinase